MTEVLPGDRSAPIADILRGFDGLRRAVALELCGYEGMAIGYDDLEIDREALSAVPTNSTVVLSAMRIGGREGAHEVEYVASVLPDSGDRENRRSRALLKARGWTITPSRPAEAVAR